MFENEWNPDRVDEYEAADRKVKDVCIIGIETHLELIGGGHLFWMENKQEKMKKKKQGKMRK